MNRGPTAPSLVGLIVAAAGCHVDRGCDVDPLPAGVRFEVTITEVTRSVGCPTATAAVGDTFVHTTGEPVSVGPNGCRLESIAPPSGDDGLHSVSNIHDCRSQLNGFVCGGVLAACADQAAGLDVTMGLPWLLKPGQEGEGTYAVHIAAAASEGCPAVSCVEQFTIHAERLD